MPEERVVVAMSGGVDSSVAAMLLKRAGYEVTGLFMRTGAHGEGRTRSCCSLEDGLDARRVADLLDIPFYALNFEAEFADVIDHFVSEYARARTPNPCIVCNRDLKFGKLFTSAASVGADHVATGHYASVARSGDRLAVRRGVDRGKDQSYVLFPLSQGQLGRILLPLGGLPKAEVRRLAGEAGLPVAEKAESQEICFVPEAGYRRLLEERGAATPGPLLDRDGTEVGRHDGMEFFTVGQRRGLGIAFGEPRYVVGIDADTAAVRLGRRDDLLSRSLIATGWVGGGRVAPEPGGTLRGAVQIRYRHDAAPATIEGLADGRVRIVFDAPQSAVTPGQAAVAYGEGMVIGGGWIEDVEAGEGVP